jgi:site-specific recombinase XerD
MAGGGPMKRRFTGPMGGWIKRHLELRRSLGFVYKGAVYCLDAFDRYLAVHFPQCRTISREMVISYLDSTKNQKPRSRSQHLSSLRQFCRFLFQINSRTYIPEAGLLPWGDVQVKPHIFTEEEVMRLIEQARKLRPNSLLPHTYVTMIGLLWVSGIRIGEAVRLNIEDIDFTNGVLHIRETKFFKSRFVPLSASTVAALEGYRQKRARFGYTEDSGTPFFINNRKKRCITATAPRTIKELMRRARLQTVDGKCPRVHDLRHSFATRWLSEFYQSGKDPTAYLPVLATYLGHANIANTQVYLHPSLELMNTAGQKFHSYVRKTRG